MPSFLVSPKMNPALAARVLASVSGRKSAERRASSFRRVVAIARVVIVLTAAFAIYSAMTLRRAMQRDVETTRAQLLGIVSAHGSSLSPADRGALERAETWLAKLAGAYDGDLLADETLFARPMLYVRGPIDAFVTPDRTADASAASYKDALLLCLVDPPPSRTERELLGKVHLARAGGAVVEDRTANVRRLHDLVAGLPVLLPPWSARVRAAADASELTKLKRELERAPIERAKLAAHTDLMLVAMDEPGAGATELDGERPHDVRLTVVDLAAGRVLMRLRKHVDPSWITPARRPTSAADLDGCALAYDVRQELRTRR